MQMCERIAANKIERKYNLKLHLNLRDKSNEKANNENISKSEVNIQHTRI